MSIEQIYNIYLQSRNVVTDSRSITPGCIFVAFRGEHFDGNAFAPQALEQGAALCIISDERYRMDDRCIVVDDTLSTLQQLAAFHRAHLKIPVIGITGTNGKTTTKELIHAVLSRRYRTSATRGNLNNHLGVPLTLLAIPADCEIAIVEMGANHPGEIADLCRIANPDFGIITNVGYAHLEGFGGFEGVVRTKTELYRHLASRHGVAFVNADSDILLQQASRLATIPETDSLIPAYAPGQPILSPEALSQCPLGIVTYGSTSDADYRCSFIASDPYMRCYFEVDDNVYTIQSHLLGAYNFDNAMAAIAIGRHFRVDPFLIKQALEEYTPSNNRSQMLQTGSNRLYLDCYNANPSSMHAALDTFCQLTAPYKSVILGGMRELGKATAEEHRKLVDRLSEMHLDHTILIGHEFDGLRMPDTWLRFPDVNALLAHLRQHPINGQTILVKGSNSNRLWQVQEAL